MKLNVATLCVLLTFAFSCQQDDDPKPVPPKPNPTDTSKPNPTPVDTCFNRFCRDFNYREGLWVEMLDSFTALYRKPSRVYFLKNSLAAWEFGDYPKQYTRVGFGRCNLMNRTAWGDTTTRSYYATWAVLDSINHIVTFTFYGYPDNRIRRYQKQ